MASWTIFGPNKRFKVCCWHTHINRYSCERSSWELHCPICNMTIKSPCNERSQCFNWECLEKNMTFLFIQNHYYYFVQIFWLHVKYCLLVLRWATCSMSLLFIFNYYQTYQSKTLVFSFKLELHVYACIHNYSIIKGACSRMVKNCFSDVNVQNASFRNFS